MCYSLFSRYPRGSSICWPTTCSSLVLATPTELCISLFLSLGTQLFRHRFRRQLRYYDTMWPIFWFLKRKRERRWLHRSTARDYQWDLIRRRARGTHLSFSSRKRSLIWTRALYQIFLAHRKRTNYWRGQAKMYFRFTARHKALHP